MLTKLGLEIIPALIVAKLLGKLRVALRIALVLDTLHGHVVAHRLSRKSPLAEVGRIIDLKLQLLSRLRATKRIVERSQRILPANLDQDILASNRRLRRRYRRILSAILGHSLRQVLHLAAKLNLSPVPIHQR